MYVEFWDTQYDKTILANRVTIDESERVEYSIDGIPDPMLRNQNSIQCFESMETLLAAFEEVSTF